MSRASPHHHHNKHELSVDVQERHAEEEKRREKKRAENAKKGIFEEEWVEVDYKKRSLDAQHIRALADLMAYLVFLFFIFLVVFLNPAEMHANKVISALDSQLDPTSVTSVAEMWSFFRAVTPQAHQTATYNGRPLANASAGEYEPLYFGPGNMALGRVRLRQLRVQADSCRVAAAFASRVRTCNAPMTLNALERSGSYSVAGAFSCAYEVHGDGYAWYSGATKLVYPSEGFVVELPLKALDAANYLAKLEANDWVVPGDTTRTRRHACLPAVWRDRAHC